MKRSELKDLIKEALAEILPDIMEVVVETINESMYQPQRPMTREKPDTTLLRQHVKGAVGSVTDYRGIDEAAPTRNVHRGPAPENPKEIIGGEVFASGKGIMEWFELENGRIPAPSEFKHTEKDMDNYLSKRFGVK